MLLVGCSVRFQLQLLCARCSLRSFARPFVRSLVLAEKQAKATTLVRATVSYVVCSGNRQPERRQPRQRRQRYLEFSRINQRSSELRVVHNGRLNLLLGVLVHVIQPTTTTLQFDNCKHLLREEQKIERSNRKPKNATKKRTARRALPFCAVLQDDNGYDDDDDAPRQQH